LETFLLELLRVVSCPPAKDRTHLIAAIHHLLLREILFFSASVCYSGLALQGLELFDIVSGLASVFSQGWGCCQPHSHHHPSVRYLNACAADFLLFHHFITLWLAGIHACFLIINLNLESVHGRHSLKSRWSCEFPHWLILNQSWLLLLFAMPIERFLLNGSLHFTP
jgi:hypothetical protein